MVNISYTPFQEHPIKVQSGKSYAITVQQQQSFVRIEFPDLLFNHNSAVPCMDETGNLIHGLQHAYFYSFDHPDEEMLVLGHTDTSGEIEYNHSLSELRAKGVLAILTNDTAEWEKITTSNSKVEDYQSIFKSLFTLHHWDCDPGEIDNEHGPKTERATKGFQKECNSIYDLQLQMDGVVGPQTWQAILKVYRILLEEIGVDPDHLIPVQASFNGIYPCGESFPIEEKDKDNFKSKTNRRVEVYFGQPQNFETLQKPSPNKLLEKTDCILCDSNASMMIPFGNKASISAQHYDDFDEPISDHSVTLLDGNQKAVGESRKTNKKGWVFWSDLDEDTYSLQFE